MTAAQYFMLMATVFLAPMTYKLDRNINYFAVVVCFGSALIYALKDM